MRIISDFQDYYDGTCAHMDPTPKPLWRRDVRELFRCQEGNFEREQLPPELEVVRRLWLALPDPESTRLEALALFCGIVVPVYKTSSGNTYGFNYRELVYHSPAKVLEVVSRSSDGGPGELAQLRAQHTDYQKSTKRWQEELERGLTHSYWGHVLPRPLTPRTVRNWEEVLERARSGLEDLHRATGSPVLTVRSEHRGLVIRADDTVKDLDLASVIHPYEAWQELDRMLSNGLLEPPPPPPTTGGDEIVRDAKGFDTHSFKHRAGLTKKDRRKARKTSTSQESEGTS